MSKKIKFLFGNQSSLTANNNKEDGALYFAKYKTDEKTETDSNTFINLYYSDGTKRLSIDPIVDYTSTT